MPDPEQPILEDVLSHLVRTGHVIETLAKMVEGILGALQYEQQAILLLRTRVEDVMGNGQHTDGDGGS
jgi:hypothetical protein